mmetsp:Transcript_70931/g.188744  ORF Transcript_70931/g.188744 Transcript_70931/m.188744 type:complete len:202 (+) Transcript_70931:579-1184(+)
MRSQHEVVRVRAVARELGFHKFERRRREVDLVGVVLVDDCDSRLRVPLDLTLRRLQHTYHQLDQRRLAVAVLAEQHDARGRVDAHLHVAQQRLGVGRAAVSESDPLDLQSKVGDRASRLERERLLRVLLESGGALLQLPRLLLKLVGLLLLGLEDLHRLGRRAERLVVAQILDHALLRLHLPFVRQLLLLPPLGPCRVVAT